MSKIKIAYVTHGLSSNGIESLLVNIVRHMDMNKYEVTFVVAIDKEVVPLHEETVRACGADIVKICDLDTVKKKIKYVKSLNTVFKENNFDIVHANMDLLNGVVLSAAKKAKIKKRICHAHTSSSTFLISNSKNFFLAALQKTYHFVMRKLILIYSTHLLGCSQGANEYMYSKKSTNALVINNGIDISDFLNKDSSILTSTNIITVGRLSPPKNPMFIIDVIHELSHLRDDFVFYWVGDGELRQEIEEQIKEKNLSQFINLLGMRTDIPEILHSCSYFLFPSLFEGLPLSLVEAQVSGLECFVSDVITEEVDLGACNFIPLDIGAKEWAKIINDTINKNQPLKADPQKLVKFDISYTVKQLDEVYCQRRK